VGESGRYPQLPIVIVADLSPHPSTKRRSGFANIYSDIKYAPARHADEFSLWRLDLIMQATKHAVRGSSVVILNELHIQFNLAPEQMRIPGF
jgi:hypothetical protein